MLPLLVEKETLVGHLETSKESVTQKVDDKENEIIKAILEDWTNTSTRVFEEQQRRNRNIIEEIIKTCSTFREEIGKKIYIMILLCF